MSRGQDYYNRLILVGGVVYSVRLRPRGSELRDLTKGYEIVHWFSALPGIISIVGWILHHTVYRRGWLVSAEPEVPSEASSTLLLDPLRKREAEQVFLRLTQWLGDGQSIEQFQPSARRN